MKRRHREREWSNEEFDEWVAASDRIAAVAAAADEEGGPRLSLVERVERADAQPTDWLVTDPLPAPAPPDAGFVAPGTAPEPPVEHGVAPAAAPAASGLPAEPFDGIALPDSRNRRAGWSADRQRLFLTSLAETGSVHVAAAGARLSARSAYALRARSVPFAQAWDTAEQLAVGRLSAIAFDRAIHGRIEQVWEEGNLVVEKRLPSDRMLMWLLARLDPRRFAAPWELRRNGDADPQGAARATFPALLADLGDTAADYASRSP